MVQLANDFPVELLGPQHPPCLSLYQPTHRRHPDNQQDPIRFRNLVKALEESLKQKYPNGAAQELLAPFWALAGEGGFWNHALDGLAVLRAGDLLKVYRLQRPVPERAVVADSFHTKPLMRIFQSADRYQILGLNRREIRLYEGNRDALDEIEPAPGVPRTIVEALGDQLTESHQSVVSRGAGDGGGVVRHGHGGKKDEQEGDTERFFRAVDRAVTERHSRPGGLPLMLAALPEYHAPFRAVSRNPLLMGEGLGVNPWAVDAGQLRLQAWEKVEPIYLRRLADLIEDFHKAKAKHMGTDDLSDAARAAVEGRVGVLLVEADRVVPGLLDGTDGRIELGRLGHPGMDDLLDDLAEMVMRRKGEVVIVPASRMPGTTGLAATYRF